LGGKDALLFLLVTTPFPNALLFNGLEKDLFDAVTRAQEFVPNGDCAGKIKLPVFWTPPCNPIGLDVFTPRYTAK
jgi:hypothetical protein